MSKLIVEVCRVNAVEDHPNAERLKIAQVKGWKTIILFNPETGKSQFEVGDLCVYFPPDSVLPKALIDRLNVEKYLVPLPKLSDGTRPEGGRVKATRLRGMPSYGIIMEIDPSKGDNADWKEGEDVSEFYGITKWEPPQECTDGDAETPNNYFFKYTSIENYGNYPSAFQEGEEIILTEKIHGKNCRFGLVMEPNEEGVQEFTFMAGSHDVRRKPIDARGKESEFWQFLTDNIKDLLTFIKDNHEWHEDKFSIMLYGEIYGSGVQDMTYGYENKFRNFRAFDISVNNYYLDYDVKCKYLEQFGVEMVPVLYTGPFSQKVLEQYTSGPTTLCKKEDIRTKFKGREGVVITPMKEEFYNPIVNGRKILKSISPDYLDRKNGTDFH